MSDKTPALAPPYADPQLETCRRRPWGQAIKKALAAFCTIPIIRLAQSQDLTDKKTKAIVAVVLGSVVQAIAVPEFYRPALYTLFYSRGIDMDMLVAASITAAYFHSVVALGFQMAGRPLGTSEFFDTRTLLITLILVMRLIATSNRYKAISASLSGPPNLLALYLSTRRKETRRLTPVFSSTVTVPCSAALPGANRRIDHRWRYRNQRDHAD